MVMLVRLEQPEKAQLPMTVTDGGMMMLVSSLQYLNASSFISVSHSGMMALPSWMS